MWMIAIFAPHNGFTQSRIEGRVNDPAGAALPYANIAVLTTADSVLVQGAVTGSDGKFEIDNIQAGNFFIVATLLGFTKATMPPFELAPRETIHLLPIILTEEPVALNAVTIEATKPLYEQQADRLVVNIQSSITAAGNTVLEVLQKSPGIIVNRQDNGISMFGKSGVRIMINGKIILLPTDAAVQMLDGMSAANVEKIELITTPAAKLDAEGTSGIIHIVMKQNEDKGTSGTVSATLGYKWAEVYGANLNLQHRSMKAAYFLDYSFQRERNRQLLNMYREGRADGLVQTSDSSGRKINVATQNLRAGSEFFISDRSTLGLLVTASRRRWRGDFFTYGRIVAGADSTVNSTMEVHGSNIWQSASAALRWDFRPDVDRQVVIDLDYIHYDNDNPSGNDVSLYYPQNNETKREFIDLAKRMLITFVVGKADYTHRLSHAFTFETGLKYVIATLDNDILVQRMEDQLWRTDAFLTSDAVLDERIGAGYISTTWKSKSLTVSGGLRYEHTITRINTQTARRIVDRRYGEIFPTFSLTKKLGKEKGFSLSYARRITRPTFRDIAPFLSFWSHNTLFSGNPQLWPAIADIFRGSYHAGPWILALLYNHTDAEIGLYQPETDAEGNLIFRSQNLQYLNTLNVTNSMTVNFAPWWTLHATVTGLYQKARTSHLDVNSAIDVYNVNGTINNEFVLPKNFSLEISGTYQSTSILGISELKPYGSLNAGVQKKFANNGALRLAMDDILQTNNWHVINDVPSIDLYSSIRYNFRNQFIRITYTRKIGNKKLGEVQLQAGSEEERKRAN
jgi:hypothetical protein